MNDRRPSIEDLWQRPRGDVLFIPPNHHLGEKRVTLSRLKRMVCYVIGHPVDLRGPRLACARCGTRNVDLLLNLPNERGPRK